MSRAEKLEEEVHRLLLDKRLYKEAIHSLEQSVGDLAQENTDLILRVRALNKIVRMLEANSKIAKKVINRLERKKK